MRQLNELLGWIIESVYDSLTCYYVLIVCVLNFLTGKTLTQFLPITVIYVLVLKRVILLLEKKASFRTLFMSLVMLCSIVLSLILLNSFEIYILVAGVGYFIFCGFYVLFQRQKGNYLPDEVKKLLIILFLSGFMTLYLKQGEHLQCINHTASFICLFSLVYFIRMNLISHYGNASMKIDSNSNIVFVNLFSLAVALIFIFLQENVVTGFPYLFLSLFMAAIRLFESIWNVFKWGLDTILAFFLRVHPSGNSIAMIHQAEEAVEEMVVEEETPARELEDIGGYVEHYEGLRIILIVLAVLLVAGLVWFCYKKMKTVLDESVNDSEEKSFVFSKKDFTESLKQKLKNLFKKEIEDPVRRRYIKAVNYLGAKGFIMEKGMTPNEYLALIDDEKELQKQDFTELTEQYNIRRYRDGK